MDEFHYYADRERGVAWQVPLLTLPQARFLLMSATLGDTTFFAEELTRLNGRPTAVVKSVDRPVPLEFAYSEIPLAQTVEKLVAEDKAPGLRGPLHADGTPPTSAQDFTSLNVCTREEKNAIGGGARGLPVQQPLRARTSASWLKHGIGLHHAGLLPKYRVLVEQLAQRGLLKIICGTDTLGVGINVPIRTVLFTKLCKYDGQKTGHPQRPRLPPDRRPGRAQGLRRRGLGGGPGPGARHREPAARGKGEGPAKKFVKRKPPERNFVNWDKKTFERLIVAPPERLVSRFQVSHGMLLNVLSPARATAAGPCSG